MKDIVIIAGKRTPMGEYGGALRDLSALDLGAIASRAAIEQSGVASKDFDHAVFGNALQTSGDALYGARHVALKAGLPIETPALTLNRLCGSGIQAIVNGAQLIELDEAAYVLAGGMESMSQAPHVIRGARWGLKLGQAEMEDSLMVALMDTYCGCYMAGTANNLANQHNISREQQDEFALRSQKAAAAAWAAGRFADEITPVELESRKGVKLFEQDDHMRPDTTMEGTRQVAARFRQGRFRDGRQRQRHRRWRRGRCPDHGREGERKGFGSNRQLGDRWSPARNHGHRPCSRYEDSPRASRTAALRHRPHRSE